MFETIHKNMDNKIAELYAATGSKEKGRRNNQPGKGKGKGVSATLDTPFDPRDPFWMKFIRVSWKNDDQIHAALQEETQIILFENAGARMLLQIATCQFDIEDCKG